MIQSWNFTTLYQNLMCNTIVLIYLAKSETNTIVKYYNIAIVLYFNVVIFIATDVTIAKW